MKQISYILLILLLSCGGDEVYIDYLFPRNAISEYQIYASEEEIATIPGAVIISSLESPKITNDTTLIDINEIGKDRYSIVFSHNDNFSFRLEQNNFLKFRLINKGNNSILFELNPQNLAVENYLIPAGNYFYEIELIENQLDENFKQIPVFIQPDLSKIREKGLDESAKLGNYKNIDLYTYISFSGCIQCNLSNANFSYMKLNNFNNSQINLSKSNLKSAIGRRTNFSNYIFDEANLNTVQFDSCNIENSTFNNIKDANYSNFQYSNLKKIKILNTSATYVKFNYCNFFQSDLQNSIFSNSEFRAVEFPNVIATNSDFSDCVFRGASLFHTDFTNSSLYNADISYSDARGTIFCNTVKNFLKSNSVLTDSLTKCLVE